MNKTTVARTTLILLLLGWMVLIFCFSAQDSSQSSDTSGSIVVKIVSFAYPDFNNLSTASQSDIIETNTVLVRKAAHFLEYFVLGALSYFALGTFKQLKKMQYFVLPFGFCVLYAISDEIHQYFVPGRACRAFDVFIDSLGAAVAMLLIIGIKKIRKSGEVNA